MSNTRTYKHWRLTTDADQILWLYFDKADASANTIDQEVMEELSAIIDNLAQDKEHIGVILTSAKTSGFIAGADIKQFREFKSIPEAVSLLRMGQTIFDKLEALTLPTVAMISGFCLGGGLELALACRYRILEDNPKTRLGLPEVMLGIHPGWGGTVRLPRLIGALNGLDLILTGKTVSAKAAAKLGLADECVPKRHLVTAAKFYILKKPTPHKATLLQQMSNMKLSRNILGQILRKKLRDKINPLHYPAPYDALDNWEYVGVNSQQSFVKEAQTCGKLFFSETCQNLVRVFFLQERLKSLAKDTKFTPKHVHVIGAGTMGGDIAAWCALQGFTVTLQDRTAQAIAPAIKRGYELAKFKLKENYLIQKVMDRLIPDIEGYGIEKADVIIEAIFEDLAAKQALFKALENKAKPQAILATNTSSIPLDEINKALQMPSRLVGIHFFNPVSKMKLVEVVQGQATDPFVFEKALTFVRKIDHLPLPVKSSPGFLVNRILMPYLLDSVVLLDEGIPPTIIDKAMTEFGMPMGPIMLADVVGLDVCLSVAKHLQQYFPNTVIPERLVKMVEEKKLGRKTGQGFYRYRDGKPIDNKEVSYDKPLDEISERLVFRMLNEAFACLHEGVVADADLLDAGMILGTGFAPFRGGPIHYAKSQGVAELYKQYKKQLAARGEKVEMNYDWEMQL